MLQSFVELAKSNSVLISVLGDYKYLHWLAYSGAKCWLLPSDTNWKVSVAITSELATPVLCSVVLPNIVHRHLRLTKEWPLFNVYDVLIEKAL